jgi:ABC-type transport system involved in multi-copper enzyme maturation permease subunit
MIAALRYEWRRLWTIRSTYWLIATVLGLQLVFCLIVAASAPPIESFVDAEEVVSAIVSLGASYGVSPLFSTYIIGLIGVFAFGHEYRHGMIRATLTAVPNRPAVFAAKALTTAALAGALAFACALIGLGAAAIFVETDGALSSGTVWSVVLGLVLFTVLFGLCGMATASLLRNQTGAVALMLLFPSVIEAVIRLVLILVSQGGNSANELARFLPFDAGSQMFARPAADVINDVLGYDPFGPVGGGLVLGVFTAALVGGALATFLQRDA